MLCDPHMGGGIKYCDWTGHIGYVVSLYVLNIWVFGFMIAIVLYVLDMWSVLFVSYAGCWDLIKRKDCMHWKCGQCCLLYGLCVWYVQI